jgi:hypothetical protein
MENFEAPKLAPPIVITPPVTLTVDGDTDETVGAK